MHTHPSQSVIRGGAATGQQACIKLEPRHCAPWQQCRDMLRGEQVRVARGDDAEELGLPLVLLRQPRVLGRERPAAPALLAVEEHDRDVRAWGAPHGTRYARHTAEAGTYSTQEAGTRSPYVQHGGSGATCQLRWALLQASKNSGPSSGRTSGESPPTEERRAAGLDVRSRASARWQRSTSVKSRPLNKPVIKRSALIATCGGGGSSGRIFTKSFETPKGISDLARREVRWP